jgi:hypothetical protein
VPSAPWWRGRSGPRTLPVASRPLPSRRFPRRPFHFSPWNASHEPRGQIIVALQLGRRP